MSEAHAEIKGKKRGAKLLKRWIIRYIIQLYKILISHSITEQTTGYLEAIYMTFHIP